MLKILIADDHPVFLRGLRQILAETPDINVTGEAANGWEVLSQVRAGNYDLVLLDITMPGMTGIEVLNQLKKERPDLPVLVLTAHPEEQYAVRALKAGAAGYLTKESAPDELVAAVRKVSRGGRYVSAALADELASYIQNSDEKSLPRNLSNREYQVLRLLCSGQTVAAIARDLSLSAKTVSTYRSRLLKKTAMKNLAGLIRYAVANRLVD